MGTSAIILVEGLDNGQSTFILFKRMDGRVESVLPEVIRAFKECRRFLTNTEYLGFTENTPMSELLTKLTPEMFAGKLIGASTYYTGMATRISDQLNQHVSIQDYMGEPYIEFTFKIDLINGLIEIYSMGSKKPVHYLNHLSMYKEECQDDIRIILEEIAKELMELGINISSSPNEIEE